LRCPPDLPACRRVARLRATRTARRSISS
jgi:hypothetical protein